MNGASFLIGAKTNSILLFPRTQQEFQKVILPPIVSVKEKRVSRAPSSSSGSEWSSFVGTPESGRSVKSQTNEKRATQRMGAILGMLSGDDETDVEDNCLRLYKDKGYDKYQRNKLTEGSTGIIYELCSEGADRRLSNQCKYIIRYSYLNIEGDPLLTSMGGPVKMFEREVEIYKHLNGINGMDVPKMYNHWICKMTRKEYEENIEFKAIEPKSNERIFKFGVLVLDKLGPNVAQFISTREGSAHGKSYLKNSYQVLSKLHQKGKVAHYDTSLLNFLLKEDKAGASVYVIDFQFSHLFGKNKEQNESHIIWDNTFLELSIISFMGIGTENMSWDFSVKLVDSDIMESYNSRNYHKFNMNDLKKSVLSVFFEQDLVKKSYYDFIFMGENRIDLFGNVFRGTRNDLEMAENELRKQLIGKPIELMNVIPYSNVFAIFDQLLAIKRWNDIWNSPLVDFLQLYKDIGGKQQVKLESHPWWLYYFGIGFYLNYLEGGKMRCLLVRYANDNKVAEVLVRDIIEGKEKRIRLNEDTKELIHIHQRYSFQDLAQVKVKDFPYRGTNKPEIAIRHQFNDFLVPLCYYKLFFGIKRLSNDPPKIPASVWEEIRKMIRELHVKSGVAHGNINVYSIAYSVKEERFKFIMLGNKGSIIDDWVDYFRVYIDLMSAGIITINYDVVKNYLTNEQLQKVKKDVKKILIERGMKNQKSINNVEVWSFSS